MSTAATEELRDLLGSYRFFAEMQRLGSRAAQGDAEAVAVLDSMLAECSADPDWRLKSRWCSSAVRALVNAGTPAAMERVLRYVEALPEDTPYGMIELLGGLLPAFGVASVEGLHRLSESDAIPARAVGIQALCNLSLEGSLPATERAYLTQLSESFVPDRYLTHHLLDLVAQQGKPQSFLEGDPAWDSLLEDVIVETTD